MPSHLATPVLPPSPRPSATPSSSSRIHKEKKKGGILRNIKRGVLILVGQEDRLASRHRKEHNERFPPHISCPPPSSSSSSSRRSSDSTRVTPRLLQTPSSGKSSSRVSSSRKNASRPTPKGSVLSVLGISVDVSSPTTSASSVRSRVPGSSLLPPGSPAPSSCGSHPTSVRSRLSPGGGLPRARRNSHQYKWQGNNDEMQQHRKRLPLPWLNEANDDAASMASFLNQFPTFVKSPEEDVDSPTEVRRTPTVVRSRSPHTAVVHKDVSAKNPPKVDARSVSTPPTSRLPSPVFKLAEPSSKDDILCCSFGSSMQSTEVANVLSAALRSVAEESSK